MGMFSKKEKFISPEELSAKEENHQLLEQFQVTKAWGVKKYQVAMQFIYDDDHKWFVVVEGPEETFRERDPYVIRFDQVDSVTVEVDEYWSEDGGQYSPRGIGMLTQDRYKEVFWRYDFYLIIRTDHPYAGTIRYKMNFKTTVMKVPQRGFIYRKGLNIGGTYEGEEIQQLISKIEWELAREEKALKRENAIGILTNTDPEGVSGKLVKGFYDDRTLKKIDNLLSHAKLGERIRKLLEV
ncbi:hypothetical protein [Baileyella intestinalis]|uniref:hypothetical protein n=1 Tax=Baileyella intestinalis TaxID=2606709 RepID=UPI0022E60956|nr:hypothetical protein [Baileyella intestinalis]